MSKQEAIAQWRETELEAVRQQYEPDNVPDYPARREAWNNWIDGMIKDDLLPARSGNWSHPVECIAPWER